MTSSPTESFRIIVAPTIWFNLGMATPLWFETHAHLSDEKFDADRDAVLERAFDGVVSGIVEIADGPAEWAKARGLAERHPGRIWWAAGLHPYYSDQATPDVLSSLEALGPHPQFVAVGEIGLDYAKCPISPERQKETLLQTLALADRIQKPVILHCREAYPDLIETLHQHGYGTSRQLQISPGVVHCFSGTKDEGLTLAAMGFYLGVDGPVTYPNAHGLRDALSAIPVEKLVIETDSPYLPPQPHRGQRNETSYLAFVGEKLAEIKQLKSAELATILRQNSETLFRLNPL